jgi:hypothetical protein
LEARYDNHYTIPAYVGHHPTEDFPVVIKFFARTANLASMGIAGAGATLFSWFKVRVNLVFLGELNPLENGI